MGCGASTSASGNAARPEDDPALREALLDGLRRLASGTTGLSVELHAIVDLVERIQLARTTCKVSRQTQACSLGTGGG
mgnify:CR=1 FL=1